LQRKKPAVEDAIRSSAYSLFQKRGYLGATMEDIARLAGTTPSNIYNYFGSKTDLIYALCGDFIRAKLVGMSTELHGIEGCRAKIEYILKTLWVDLPQAENGMARNLIQAIATMPRDAKKPSEALTEFEGLVGDLILAALPPRRAAELDGESLAHIIWMAFDGFSVNFGFESDLRLNAAVASFAHLLLGAADAGAVRSD
jgi:AcrR family transcriptional regulator